jgi:hypothetical protein
MEIQNVDHKARTAANPGPWGRHAGALRSAMSRRARSRQQANVPIATPGGKPVTMSDGAPGGLDPDVDNRFIEISSLRVAASRPPCHPTSNIIDIRVSIAEIDIVITDEDGVELVAIEGFTMKRVSDRATQALTGLSNAQVRRSRAQSQGSTLWLEFVEFKGVDRTPLRVRIQDRGAARLQLRTQNIDAMVAAVKSAGLTVVTQGGAA